MSQVAVLVEGFYWHKNAWKIYKGRWLASRIQLFTFSGAARNAESLFSKQPMLVRSAGLRLVPGRDKSGASPFPKPSGTHFCPLMVHRRPGIFSLETCMLMGDGASPVRPCSLPFLAALV